MTLEARRVRAVRIYYERRAENGIAKKKRERERERERERKERSRRRVVPMLKERLLCNMLIFNDLERNSLRSTYLLNGVV